MFMALFRGYSEARFEYGFEDKVEELPGETLLEQQEIKKALNGESFNILGDSGENVRITGFPINDFLQCFRVWDDFHILKKLPHGDGTLNEQQWVVTAVKIGEKAYSDVQAWVNANPARASIKR